MSRRLNRTGKLSFRYLHFLKHYFTKIWGAKIISGFSYQYIDISVIKGNHRISYSISGLCSKKQVQNETNETVLKWTHSNNPEGVWDSE